MTQQASNNHTDIIDELEQLGIGEGFLPELYQMLASIQLLQDFDGHEIESLARYCGGYRAAKGTKIFEEGKKSGFMCLLIKGKVNILKQNKKVATIRVGKSMGEMSILDGFPCSATAICAEDSEIVMITRSKFEQLCQNKPDVALKLLKDISKLMSLRLRQMTGMLIDFL